MIGKIKLKSVSPSRQTDSFFNATKSFEKDHEGKFVEIIHDLKNKLKGIRSNNKFEITTDKLFFMCLDRLAKAERLKETDRLDARYILDQVIQNLKPAPS